MFDSSTATVYEANKSETPSGLSAVTVSGLAKALKAIGLLANSSLAGGPQILPHSSRPKCRALAKQQICPFWFLPTRLTLTEPGSLQATLDRDYETA